jgi:hypothetical protein
LSKSYLLEFVNVLLDRENKLQILLLLSLNYFYYLCSIKLYCKYHLLEHRMLLNLLGLLMLCLLLQYLLLNLLHNINFCLYLFRRRLLNNQRVNSIYLNNKLVLVRLLLFLEELLLLMCYLLKCVDCLECQILK